MGGTDKKVQGETLCHWLWAINCSGISFLFFSLFSLLCFAFLFFLSLGSSSNIMNLLKTTGLRFNFTFLYTHTHSNQADCVFKLVESID